ncbi:MAG: hypothetical protein ACYDBP_07170 [Leptospirales bacterium]
MLVQVAIRMDSELKKDLENFARIAGVTQNDAIVHAIETLMFGSDKMENEDLYAKLVCQHIYTQTMIKDFLYAINRESPEVVDLILDHAKEASDHVKKVLEEGK